MRKNLRNLHDADKYDDYASQAMGPWDELVVQRAVQLKPELAGDRCFVDVGTGTGVIPELVAGHAEYDGFSLIGFEYFDDMVDRGNQRIQTGVHKDRIKILKGDAHALPLPDASVDVLVCRATLHHLEKPVVALKDMARVLKPGGIAIIHDPRRDAPAEILKAFNEMRAKVGYSPTTLDEKFTLDEVRALVSEADLAGFSEINVGDGMAALGFELLIRKPA